MEVERAKKDDDLNSADGGGGSAEEVSVERIFEESADAPPPWQNQLTFRAMIVSFILSILFTFVVMKLNLTTGIIPSLNISAGLLSFFFVKTWTKILNKAGILKQPFTRQENTVIQTCVVASSGIAFSGGFGSYLFGMSEVVAKQSPEANTPLNIKNPHLGWMIGFLFTVSFLGLFSVVPLRKIMIVDFKLTYPSGTATAHLINSFHTPQGAKLAKKQVRALGKFFSFSFLWGFFQWFFTSGDGCGFANFPTFGLEAYENKFYFDFSATYVGVGMICPYLINVWRYWKEAKGIEIVDAIIMDSSSSALRTHEILRCIQIGLLCVQERAEDRPVMSTVMVMLGSETTAIPQPKRPGFCVGRSLFETESSPSTQRDDDLTVNQITLSVIEARGFPEYYVFNKETIIYRSGPWIGNRFSCVPEMKPIEYMVYTFIASNEEVSYSYHMTKPDVYSTLSLSYTGTIQRRNWIEQSQAWKQLWYQPKDICDNYRQCGNYGYCDSNSLPNCNCIKGFGLGNGQEWALRDDSAGCVRKTRLSCDGRDGFVAVKRMKLPDTAATVLDRGIGLKECEAKCLQDCNCTAYANTDIRDGGSGCVIWKGGLFDIRSYANGGQDLYVKLAAADLG
ncbi:hypothetical protein F2Q68_00045908 [Brassica cretica]|uniref:Apple domain-containing protein n=1 Tax=Brassica cretica TaxID=69181 RepID=A0A8S9LKY4_BRACR|nr:hypothetical protein F2Q68_00045908 [Brassica cretica]